MSDGTNIEWADASWNPVVGCTRVSEGCRNCYAEAMAHRFRLAPRSATPNDPRAHPLNLLTDDNGRWNGTVRLLPERLSEPLHWRKPRRIFVCSMSDLFHDRVPLPYIGCVMKVAAACPHLTFLLLTKRPERMCEAMRWVQDNAADATAWVPLIASRGVELDDDGVNEQIVEALRRPLPNVWLGVSVENQQAADDRIPHLLNCPAEIRWLSVEPLLDHVDLSAFFGRGFCGGSDTEYTYNAGVSWVVVGGESGRNARPCSINWINSIQTQCHAARVPLFVKQLGRRPVTTSTPSGEMEPFRVVDPKGGSPREWPHHLRVRQWPEMRRG